MSVTIDGTNGVYTPNVLNNGANGVGNIGNATTYFNTVFAKATSAQYADLAEVYNADAEYSIGTVLIIGGINEVTISTQSCDTRIAGVVSSSPAYIMNAGQIGQYTVNIALIGRVPCQVVGNVDRGDLLVSSDVPGVARKILPDETIRPGSIIGKSLEKSNEPQVKIVEILVGRL